MSIDVAEGKVYTSEDLFAMRPSKKVDRWLFRGELRETKVTRRNPSHSMTVATVTTLLNLWLRTRPQHSGRVYTGDVYFRVRLNPETNFGIDIAVSTPEQAANTTKKSKYLDGPPLLAIEILSPSDKQKEIHDKIEEYLECGVALVWIIDPLDETVTVYKPGQPPCLFNITHVLDGGPELPGFSTPVANIFA